MVCRWRFLACEARFLDCTAPFLDCTGQFPVCEGSFFLRWRRGLRGKSGAAKADILRAESGFLVNGGMDPMTTMSTLEEINQKARAILARELGPVDYVRFFRQYEPGRGDYTQERQQRPAEGVATIHQRVVARQAAGLLPPPPNARILEL